MLIRGHGYNYLTDVDVQTLASLGLLQYARYDSHVFYVNADTSKGKARPQHSGQDFRAPLLTFSDALTNVETGRGDIILLQHSTTAITEDDISVAKADIVIAGMTPSWFGGVHLNPSAASTAAVFSLTAAADRILFKNLKFTTTTSTKPAILTASSAHNIMADGCKFILTAAGAGINFDAGAVNDPVITNCDFYVGTSAGVPITMECGTTGGLIRNCTIMNMLSASGTPLADGILVKAGTGLVIRDVHISGGASTDYNIVDGIDIDSGVLNTLIADCTIGNCDNGVTDGGTDTAGATAGEGWIDTTHA